MESPTWKCMSGRSRHHRIGLVVHGIRRCLAPLESKRAERCELGRRLEGNKA
jgi:hypothetical protein